jgi:hypothetical protein
LSSKVDPHANARKRELNDRHGRIAAMKVIGIFAISRLRVHQFHG